MNLKVVIPGLLFLAVPARTEEEKPPVIPVEVLAEYFRADSAVMRLQTSPQWVEASGDLQRAAEALKTLCGKAFQPQQSGKTVVCSPLPKPPATKEIPVKK